MSSLIALRFIVTERFIKSYHGTDDSTVHIFNSVVLWLGDDDAACSTSGEQYWLNRWKNYVRDDSTNWLPWKSDDLQLGGYHTIYHNRNNMDFNALHLITVRSAGHMVPTTQPGRSLTVLRKFLFELSDYPTAKGKGGWRWINKMVDRPLMMMIDSLHSVNS